MKISQLMVDTSPLRLSREFRIVFGTGYIRIGQMVKAGVILNIVALFLVLGIMYTAVLWVFGL